MKLQGILGKGTGKLGSSIFAVSGGEQVVREYNKEVSNPNTEGQIAQRAKLKLMSQLAATLAPAMGFAKMGLVSARNQFVSKNIGLCTFQDNKARVDLTELQLTPSSILIGLLNATGGSGTISAALGSSAAADIKRVAYFIYLQNENDQLQYITSKIVTEAGEGRTFPTTFNVPQGEYVVYAYGIKDNSMNATIRYENYVSAEGDSDAILDVVSLFRSTDYGLTATSGAVVSVVS